MKRNSFVFNQIIMKSHKRLVKKAGGVLYLDARQKSGVKNAPLTPRTLPNGIANSPYLQRVSGDYVIQASDMSIVTSATNVDQVSIGIAKLVGIIDSGVVDGVATKVASTNSVPLNGTSADNVASIGRHYLTTTSFRIIVAKGTTLAEAQALLAGTVIHYQLATPIDTLNAPFTNPLIDLANSVGKNLFDGFLSSDKIWSNASMVQTTLVGYKSNAVPIQVIPNTNYYLSINGADAVMNNIRFYTSGGAYISEVYTRGSFLTPSNCGYVCFYGTDSKFVSPNIQLELGSVATAYEPYKKNNALLQNFSATSQDGYTIEATVNSNGQAVGYSNLVVNGDFANGTIGWAAYGGTIAVINGELEFTEDTSNGEHYAYATVLFTPEVASYYFETYVLNGGRIQFYNRKSDGGWEQINGTTIASIGISSNIINITSRFSTPQMQLRLYGKVGSYVGTGAKYKFDNVMTVKLSTSQITAFETQLGKPLDAAACDRIFPFVATTGTTLVSARPYVATDGLDSLGVMANNPSVDIVGTEDFAIAWCGLTPTTLQAGYVMFKGLDSGSNAQYAVYLSGSGGMFMNLNGAESNVTGALLPNTNYDIRIIRLSGRLKCWVNGVLKYDQANVVSIITQPNLRLFARSNNAGGTTASSFAKLLTAYLILARGTYGDINKLDKALDKVSKDYR